MTTISRQIQCIERELQMRRAAYPHMVSKRRMTQAAADEEISAMEAILDTLRQIAARDGELPEPPAEALRRKSAVVLYFPDEMARTAYLRELGEMQGFSGMVNPSP
jgi:hypothetical protein